MLLVGSGTMIEIFSTDYINKKQIIWKIQKEYEKYQRLMTNENDKEKKQMYLHKRDAIEQLQDAILKENQ